jgi:hypothetical protein
MNDFEAHGMPKALADAARKHIADREAIIEQTVYVGFRVVDLPQPHVASETRKCDICGQALWVDADKTHYADLAKGINCIPCVEKREGRPLRAILMDELNKATGTEL